jgi:hypothetical protein
MRRGRTPSADDVEFIKMLQRGALKLVKGHGLSPHVRSRLARHGARRGVARCAA